MKRLFKEKFNFKSLYTILVFLSPTLFILLFRNKLDNDIWGMLTQGRYIFEHGIYKIDPFTIHNGLNVVVQNWGSALLFYIIFKLFKEYGLLLLVLICTFIITRLVYKISMLISDNHHLLSLIISLLTIINLSCYYMVTRSQIISYISLLLVIYLLELYIKKKNKKYLYFIPLISLFQINYHSSLWLFIFLFTLPYIIDGIKIPFIETEKYKIKPIIIIMIISFLVGLINPYGIKAISFIFGSFSNSAMHELILELHPFSLDTAMGLHMTIITFIIVLLCLFFKKGKIKVRYVCLICGTLLLGLMSYKGFSEYLLVCFIPFANYFKDILPRIETFNENDNLVINIIFLVIDILGIIFTIFMIFLSVNNFKLTSKLDNGLKYLNDNYDKNDIKLYNSFNNGGYLEFNNYKTFIDPKAEVFLMSNNGKKDILQEYVDIQNNDININNFLEEYDFTHLFVTKDDEMYSIITKEKDINYILEYVDDEVALYTRKDLCKGNEQHIEIVTFKKN